MTSKLGTQTLPRMSMVGAYLLAMWCPVYRWRNSKLGLGWELFTQCQGKPYKCETRRGTLLMGMRGADHPAVATKRL